MFGFDIFCRVIDYFGDAGVCWRLAQSLADPSYGHSVRLWVDNLHTLARIEPKINPRKKHQVHNHVDIKFWPTKGDNTIHFSWPNPYQVAIETFSCGLPNAFAVQMKGAHIHINLDHLSAEKWVEYAHGLSLFRHSFKEPAAYYFAPGFSQNTGGLLREKNLLKNIQQWHRQSKSQQWAQLATPLKLHRQHLKELVKEKTRIFFLFQYEHAPIQKLISYLHAQQTLTKQNMVFIFAADQVNYIHAKNFLKQNPNHSIHLVQLPYVSQKIFDKILWSCDFNFVRGEDSFLRALWAQKPFIWQPYPQAQQQHLLKLKAWLDTVKLPAAVNTFHWQWNQSYKQTIDFNALNPVISNAWKKRIKQLVHRLQYQPTLTCQIAQFAKMKTAKAL